jgi:uncharacterized membrane protein YiaA
MSEIGKFIGRLIGKIIGKKVGQKLEDIDAKKKIDYNQQFAFELRHAKRNYFGVLLLVGFGLFIVYELLKDVLEGSFVLNDDTGVLIGIAVFFIGAAIYLLGEVKARRIVLTNSFINNQGFFGKDKELRWNDITTVVFDDRKRMITLSDGTSTIKVMKMLVGSRILLRLISDKVNISVYFRNLNENKAYLDDFANVFSETELETYKMRLLNYFEHGVDSNMLDLD